MKFPKILIFIASLGASLPVQAMTVGDYKNVLKQHPERVDFYILGVGAGTSWANTFNKSKNLPLLYCQPNKLALNVENYKRVIKDELEKYSERYNDNIPVEMVLIKGLERTFPCDG